MVPLESYVYIEPDCAIERDDLVRRQVAGTDGEARAVVLDLFVVIEDLKGSI
jgi:hypothetical protein